MGAGAPSVRAPERAVALSLHQDIVRAVDKAVKGPLRHDWIGEERIPVLRGSVRYHHERT